MAERIKEYIIGILLERGPITAEEGTDNYRFLDTGHIDSLALIKFVFRLEDRFGVKLDPDDIGSEEFRTIGGLAKLIARKANNARN